ncbi:MAG: hypothetical protein AAGF81_04550, partial [Pseudomonadota bacterium]
MADLINLAAYPIADPAGPERARTVARLRDELDRQQYCVLPEFIGPDMCAQLVQEVYQRLPEAYGNRSRLDRPGHFLSESFDHLTSGRAI